MGKCKDAFKIVTFIVVLFILIYLMGFFLSITNDNEDWELINGFYQKEENSIDVVCLGSSGMFTAFNPALAWYNEGFTGYDYGTSTMPVSSFKYALEEIQKTQKPQLYVIDLETASYDKKNQTSISNLHRYFDVVPASLNTEMMKVDILGKNIDYGLFHSLALHHYQYSTVPSLKSVKLRLLHSQSDEKLNGCYISSKSPDFEEGDFDILKENDGQTTPLPEDGEPYLIDLLEYLKENQLNVLFIYTPRVFKKGSTAWQQQNYVGELVQSYGFDIINYSDDPEQYGLNIMNDFYGFSHLNVFGQEKFTNVLSNEISKRINIHGQTEARKKLWNEYYQYYTQKSEEAKRLNKEGISETFTGYDIYRE